jgi:hypothetical protein
MLFDCPCKTGRLQVDETTVQVVALFTKKPLWLAPRETVTSIVKRWGAGMLPFSIVDLTISTAQGVYPVSLAKQNAEKFLAFFPGLGEQAMAGATGHEWYQDPNRLTYVATYTKEKAAQREMEMAAGWGWMPQGTAGTAGHVNVGRTLGKVVLTGGIGLMLTGASRSKDKITLTFVRTPEWVTQHGK